MYQLILVIKLSLVKNFKKYFLSHFEQIIAFSLIVKVISRLSTITLKLAKITHFPMAIFYISIYFIITVFLNDAIRFCSKMPLSGDSCCTEICRARRSTGVCAMEVFTAWHFLTDKRYKTLLLFNSHPALRNRGDVAATSQRRLSLRPSDLAGTSQMKHPMTSRWNVAKTSQW